MLLEIAASESARARGLMFREKLPRGKRVLLEVSLPNGSRLEAIGRVAWTQKALPPENERPTESAGVGIEFLGGASDQFSAFESWIEDRASRLEGQDD